MTDFIIPATPGWEVADGVALEVGEVIAWAMKTDKLGDVTALPIYAVEGKEGRAQTPQREYDGGGPTATRRFILKRTDDA